MEAKPLSGRLVNEQGIVTAFLLDISPSLDGYAVRVKEAEQEYVGIVKLVKDRRDLADYKAELDAYAIYLKEKAEYDAMSDSMKATKGTLKEVQPVTVQLNRTTHDAFPLMQ